MKGLAQVILAATPLALIILYYSLSGQEQVRTDQVVQEAKQVVQEASFDLEFERMQRSIMDNPMTEDEIRKRIAEIEKIKSDAEKLGKKMDQKWQQSQSELDELRQALKEYE